MNKNMWRSALLAVLLLPGIGFAGLIQEITVLDYSDEELGDLGDFHFGTLIFPNEAQQPFEFDGNNPTCVFPNTFNDPDKPAEAEGLPLCEAGEFVADKDSFAPFNDLDGNGTPIPDSLNLFGGWFIDDDWQVQGIFAWTAFGFGQGDILTLVFGNLGGICGTVQSFVAVNCFNPIVEDKEIFTYRLDPAHSVPEPGTLALLGLGLVGLAARRRKTV